MTCTAAFISSMSLTITLVDFRRFSRIFLMLVELVEGMRNAVDLLSHLYALRDELEHPVL